MEIISYVKWTEPGEFNKFLELVTTTKDNIELKEKIMKIFNVDKTTANIVILRYKNKINSIRLKQQCYERIKRRYLHRSRS